jgi:hypothetical protein
MPTMNLSEKATMKRLFLTLILSTGFAGAASAAADENAPATPGNGSALTGRGPQAVSPEEDADRNEIKRQLLFQMLSQTYDGALGAAGRASGAVTLKNENAVAGLAPQGVSFEGADGCRYFGTTRNPDTLGGIQLNIRLCGTEVTFIRDRAYMMALHREASGQALIPAGSGWLLSPRSGDPAAGE